MILIFLFQNNVKDMSHKFRDQWNRWQIKIVEKVFIRKYSFEKDMRVGGGHLKLMKDNGFLLHYVEVIIKWQWT